MKQNNENIGNLNKTRRRNNIKNYVNVNKIRNETNNENQRQLERNMVNSKKQYKQTMFKK